MESLPNGAPALPPDYAAWSAIRVDDESLGRTRLYRDWRDPSMCLGKQGSENFPCCLMIGERQDQLFVMLLYAPPRPYEPPRWRYVVTAGAEWDIAAEFPDFAALHAFLGSETPLAPPTTRRNRG